MASNAVKPQIFVTEFDADSIKKLMEDLCAIESQYAPHQPILVHIDSYGGAVHGLSVLYNKLKSLPNPIITYTSSKAMSAGAILLSTVASPGNRLASPEADIMIHEIQSADWGDIKDLEDGMRYTKRMNTKWMGILAKSMGLKSASEIRQLIKQKAIGHNVYLSAQQAKKIGIIDDIANIKMTPYHGWDFIRLK